VFYKRMTLLCGKALAAGATPLMQMMYASNDWVVAATGFNGVSVMCSLMKTEERAWPQVRGNAASLAPTKLQHTHVSISTPETPAARGGYTNL